MASLPFGYAVLPAALAGELRARGLGSPHAEMRRLGVEIGRTFPPLDHWTRITIGLPTENARARNVLREVLKG